jgi:hypothetical protein
MFQEAASVKLTDLRRVCELPTLPLLTEGECEEVSKFFVQGEAYDEGFRLLPEQCNMVMQFVNYNGLLGSAAAGAGKTLASLLIANIGYEGVLTTKHNKVMLMVPSKLVDQLKANMRWARRKIHFPADVYFFKDHKPEDRLTLAKSNKPGIYVLGYGFLSTQNAEELINETSPSLIIADEAHKIAGKSARRRRVEHYLKQNPSTSVCLMSGTMMNKELLEIHVLGKYALKENLPMPLPWPQVAALSEALAPKGPIIPMDKMRMARDLVDWAGMMYDGAAKSMQNTLRKAYHKRLATAPGVFLSEGSKVAASINFDIHEGRMTCPKVAEYIKQVEDTWTTPDDQTFETALEKFKWIKELNNGFYNSLTWPEEHPLLEEAKYAHELGKLTKSLIRKFIGEKHRPGLDTPLLVRNDMQHHGSRNVGSELFETWKAWKVANSVEGLPERISRFVRVSDEKVTFAVERWTKIDPKLEGGVVWFQRQGHGIWLCEEFEKAFGSDTIIHAPAGMDLNTLAETQDLKGKIIIASIGSHGTGVDGLQHHFNKMLYASDLNTVADSEQSIARLHRTGQEADEVEVHLLSCSKYDEMQLAGILQDNYFLHLTMGKRRVFEGGWLTAPRSFDQKELLKEGVDVKNRLSKVELRDMQEVTG